MRQSIFIFGLLITIALPGCNSWLVECVEFNVKEVVSPGGEFIARSRTKDCGATTNGFTSVRVRRIDKEIDQSVSAFNVFGEHNIFMRWKSESELLIECSDCKGLEKEPVVFSTKERFP